MNGLPFSQACENNKAPILERLQVALRDAKRVLEIGSGTAQHATWFAAALAHLVWQPTELPQHLAVTIPRCRAYAGANLLAPVALDVTQRPWSVAVPDAVYTANTLHIMGWPAVQSLFAELGEQRQPGQRLVVYGPFNYGGEFTSESNARFDALLRARDPASGIRDFEAVDAMARSAGLALWEDWAMPANNRLLVWG